MTAHSTNPNHGCRAFLTANKSIPNNSETLLDFNAVDWDHSGEMDIVTNKGRFTPTQSGIYDVYAVVSFASATGLQRYCCINKNGSKEVEGGKFEAPDSPEAGLGTCTVVGMVKVNGTTDYIEIVGYQNSGGALNAYGTRIYTHVSIAIRCRC